MESCAILALGSYLVGCRHNGNLALAAFVSNGDIIIGMFALGGLGNGDGAGIIGICAHEHILGIGAGAEAENKKQ